MRRFKFGWIGGFILICALVQAEEGRVRMNFENADLRVVIKFVSEVTGENFIMDEELKGTVSIMGPKEISVGQLRKVLESVLWVSGYTMIPSDEMTQIVPLETIQKENVQSMSSPEGKDSSYVTQVVPLKFASSEKLVNLLTPFLTRGGHASFYPETQTLIVSDVASNLDRINQMIRQLDRKEADQEPRIFVYTLRHSLAEEMVPVLEQLIEKEKSQMDRNRSAGLLDRMPAVVADSKTNSLVISASRARYSMLEEAIRKLDVAKKQVLVEVLVVEVNENDLEKLGIEWATFEGAFYGSQEGFGQDRVNRVEDIVHNAATGGNFPGTSAAYIHDAFQIGTLEIPRLGILVNAFRHQAGVNILSTPQIFTTDHVEAEILVGENRAFIKNAQVTPEGSTIRTFEFRDVGLSLRMTPHICDDEHIRMDIHQKVEDVIGQTFEGAVETAKREARTTITVKNSQTAVIGGLIREKKNLIIKKVPVLGDIPLIGLPFRRKEEELVKTNLLIFICPRLVENDEQQNELSQMKRTSIENVGSEHSGKKSSRRIHP